MGSPQSTFQTILFAYQMNQSSRRVHFSGTDFLHQDFISQRQIHSDEDRCLYITLVLFVKSLFFTDIFSQRNHQIYQNKQLLKYHTEFQFEPTILLIDKY